MKVIVMMLNKSVYRNQPKPLILNKTQSSYKKLEKAMNEAPKEYEQIKKLIEDGSNDLKNFSNKTSKNDLQKNLPHQKNNVKSKK